MTHRFCDDRTCALNSPYTLCLQSEDAPTLLAGLKVLLGDRDFTAHVFCSETMWGAWVPSDSMAQANELSKRLVNVAPVMGHPIRFLVEDELEHAIKVDRTYQPGGEVTEPLPIW